MSSKLLVNINSKLILYTSILFFGVFWFVPTHAATYVPAGNQLQFDTSYALIGTNNGFTGQQWTPTFSGKIKYLYAPVWRYQGTGATCQFSITNAITSAGSDTRNNLRTSAPTTIGDWELFTWSSTYNVTAGNTYWVYLSCGNNTQFSNLKLLGTSSSTYSGGVFGTSTDSGVTIAQTGLGDMGFKFYVEVTGNATISFNQTPTTINDFGLWFTNAYVSTASTTEAQNWDRVVKYSFDGVTYGVADRWGKMFGPIINPFTLQYDDPVGKIPKAMPLAAGLGVWAQAFIYNTTIVAQQTTSTIVATSSIWYFTVNAGPQVPDSGYQAPITATSTDNAQNFTCDPNSGFFASSLCKLFMVLFMPTSEHMDQFSNLKNLVANKPPFAYFNIYSSAIEDLGTSTSTTSTISTSTTDMHLDDWSDLTIVSTVRNIFAWFLFIPTAFYLFHRFRNISMHG